jgi:hypothetical protein
MSKKIPARRAFLSKTIPYRTGFYIAFVPAILSFALFWAFGADKVRMMPSTSTPAAQGTVSVSATSNDNIKVDVKVQSLANPSTLTPAENVYVVWIQPQGQPPQNQGEIKVDKNENAQIHTQTSFKRFKLFITAEQNAQVQAPTGPQVLSADVVPG